MNRRFSLLRVGIDPNSSGAQGVGLLSILGLAVVLLAGCLSGACQTNGVYAYTGAITDSTEVLSPYYSVYAVTGSTPAVVGSMTPLYVYQAQVKSINFTQFTSPLTGQTFKPDIWGTDTAYPSGASAPYSANLAKAGFASFQPLAPTGTSTGVSTTITVIFKSGYPTTPINSVNILSNVTKNSSGFFNSNGTGNIGPVTIWAAGNPYSYPAGSFSFTVTEQTDSTSNHGGIPEQLTIEVGGSVAGVQTTDFLQSLHIFCNPHPDTLNSLPTSHVDATPSVGTALATIPSGSVVHFPPGTYWLPGNNYIIKDRELYLDDGAILKYHTPAPGSPRTCGTNQNCNPMIVMAQTTGNAIIRGWGIFDGQAETQQAQYTASYLDNRDGHTYTVSGNCGSSASPLSYVNVVSNSTQTALLDGIILRDSCSWTLPVWSAKGTATTPVTINNIKIFGYGGAVTPGTSNADGIDLISSQYVNVLNSFIRTTDDLITIKQTNPAANAAFSGAINVVNNTLWNEVAHAMVVGGETYNGNNPSGSPLSMDDIIFDSNVIVHDTGKAPLMGILNSYGGVIQNIGFSNNVAFQSVGLISITESPSPFNFNVASYSMAPSTGSGPYASDVTFTMPSVAAPPLQVGQTFNLSAQSSWTSTWAVNEHFGALVSQIQADGLAHNVAQQYAITAVGTDPVSGHTTFTATLTGLPVAVPTTETGTESGSTPPFGTVQFNPGILGGTHFCNITQTTPQVATVPIIGPGYVAAQPYVAPISNITELISLGYHNPYVGGASPGYPSMTFPRTFNYPPQMWNIQVAAPNTSGVVVLNQVASSLVGNDFYYLASDGLKTTNSTQMSPYVVEETVRTRDYYETNPNQLFDYAISGVVGGDLYAPQILAANTSCPVSSLMPIAR